MTSPLPGPERGDQLAPVRDHDGDGAEVELPREGHRQRQLLALRIAGALEVLGPGDEEADRPALLDRGQVADGGGAGRRSRGRGTERGRAPAQDGQPHDRPERDPDGRSRESHGHEPEPLALEPAQNSGHPGTIMGRGHPGHEGIPTGARRPRRREPGRVAGPRSGARARAVGLPTARPAYSPTPTANSTRPSPVAFGPGAGGPGDGAPAVSPAVRRAAGIPSTVTSRWRVASTQRRPRSARRLSGGGSRSRRRATCSSTVAGRGQASRYRPARG